MSDKTTIPVPVINLVRKLLQAEVNWDHLDNGLLDVGIDLNYTYAPNVFDLVVEIVFGPEASVAGKFALVCLGAVVAGLARAALGIPGS